MSIYKGIETWIVLISEEKRSEAAIALRKAKISFKAAKGGSTNGHNLALLEIPLAEASKKDIERALSPI